MLEIDLRARLLGGGGALVARQVVVRGLQIAGTIVLARILSPADFGIFVIVSLFVTFLANIGDLGVAGSLIQRSDEPTEHDLAVAFAVQMGLAFGLGGVLIVISGVLVATIGLTAEAASLLRLLAIASIISGIRTIPTVLLERQLEFGKLATAEIAQAIAYQGVAVGLAAAGAGVLSFGVAALASAATVTLAIYLLRPWRPHLALDGAVVRSLLRFGIPYQGASFVSFVKDALNPVFIGLLAGPDAVGLVNWAATIVTYPLQMLAVMNRLYFPAFSRLRTTPSRLEPIAEAVIRWNVGLAVVALVPFVLAAPFWTEFIFGAKWLPAVPVAYLIAVTVPFAAAAGPGMSILNAFGRSDVVFGFTFIWMVSTWVIGIPAILFFGIEGYGMTSILVTLTTAFFYVQVRRQLRVPIWPSVWASIAGVIAALVARWLLLSISPVEAGSITAELVLSAVEVLAYAVIWALLLRPSLRRDARMIRSPELTPR